MKSYDHKKIEKKWQKQWAKDCTYETKESTKKKACYVLDMFPYPSGEGLHVGHPKGYIASDIYARHKRMQGFSVLHPMGWDAFGLPAENYALEHKVHPKVAVKKNIARFKKQLEHIGFDYDWKREINTTDPAYYKWTQWIFLQLFKKGLAYQSNEPINWCPSCKTGLANEDLEGNACERCGTIVEKKKIKQWVLKITEYADRLLTGLETLPWPKHIQELQKNWIGKSEGAEIDFPIASEKKYKVIIFHGYTGTPNNVFIPWLKQELEKQGHKVVVPFLPHSADKGVPEKEDVAVALAATTYDENTIIVGHSLGAVVALKVLEKIKTTVARTVLVGGFIDVKFKDHPRPFEKTFSWSFDAKKIKAHSESIQVLQDYNDDVVSREQAERLAHFLDVPLNMVFANGTHFCSPKEPEILLALFSSIRVFTTRADTLFGATYLVLAPEHALAKELADQADNKSAVHAYIAETSKKIAVERLEHAEKTGIELKGVKAINPGSGEKIPIFIADHVLGSVGTGAIMAVPAHDERDFEFARKFGLEIREVVEPLFVKIAGSDGIRAGESMVERNAVVAIIKHPTEEKYLGLKWKKNDWQGFVVGGLEDGEDMIIAGTREIQEETGYKNAKFIKKLGGKIHSQFYHEIKKQNRFAHFDVLYFELANKDRDAVDVEEQALHDVVWLAKEDVAAFASKDEDMEFIWKRFLADTSYTGEGLLANSGEFNGLSSEEAKNKITARFGKEKTTYKLRDWVFSRQRYWGEPIPIVHCEKCGAVPVPEKDLPVLLPKVASYEPSGTGESPLATIAKWVNVRCPLCGGHGKRETNTMPQWAGSSWYYLRYMDPTNIRALVSKKKEQYWKSVSVYVGGIEHATRHLIYARFWHKFLFDIGIVETKEPFEELHTVGLVLAEDGRKMSKRYKNTIDPDDVVALYGADSLRLYEMFMGPFENTIAWDMNNVIGVRRFLERVWRLHEHVQSTDSIGLERMLHKTIKKVGEDIAAFKFNTAISQMMIFLNAAEKEKGIGKNQWKSFLKLLSPFAPHITDELWHLLGNKKSVHTDSWPTYEEGFLAEETVTIAVQINGKTRSEVSISLKANEAEYERVAQEAISARLQTLKVVRVVVVKGRLVNFVTQVIS